MIQQQEQALLAAFRLMDSDEREFHLEAFQRLVRGRANRRPELRLIANDTRKQ